MIEEKENEKSNENPPATPMPSRGSSSTVGEAPTLMSLPSGGMPETKTNNNNKPEAFPPNSPPLKTTPPPSSGMELHLARFKPPATQPEPSPNDENLVIESIKATPTHNEKEK